MAILSRLFETRAHPSQPDEWLISLLGGRAEAATGVTITPETSLESTVVYACVRILAESVAGLPLPLYRRLDNGGKERATDHPLYSLLHDLPNPEMTAFQLRETLMGHLGLWGNAFAEIESNGGGQITGLWPLRPDLVVVKRINRRLVYDILMPKGPNVRLPWSRVMHIAGFGTDGVVGYSPISLARQAVGLSLGTEEFGARFFGNGARPGIVLEHPGKLSDEAHKRLAKSIEERHQGLSNAHRLMILEEGMGVKEVGIPPEDAQYLETRKFQVAEIARMYRIPPHMVGDLERATFSNIEQQSLEFVIFTLTPWLVRIEQAISRDLLTDSERMAYFAEHLVAGLLRGDIQSRYEAYSIGRQNGWLSANDIRILENMNPVEGGDEYLIPLNMISTSAAPDIPRSAPAREGRDLPDIETRARQTAQSRRDLAIAFQRVIEDTAGRVVRREANDVRRAANKFLGRRSVQEFNLWLAEFYEDHRQFFIRNFLPILQTFAEQVGLEVARELDQETDNIDAFIEEYVTALAARQIGESHLQLKALLDQALQENEDPGELVEARLDEWSEKRPGAIARKESFNASNAFAKAFYLGAGITHLRWVASGENCPYCRDLDGIVVGILQFFLGKETDFQPDGADRPLNVRYNVGHPPAHDGCDCNIVAER